MVSVRGSTPTVVKASNEEVLRAIALFKSLRRGDQVIVKKDGKEQKMLVSRPLIFGGGESQQANWPTSNIHVTAGLNSWPVSITIEQQLLKGKNPHIVALPGRDIVRAVPVGPDLYKRLDELASQYGADSGFVAVVKNMLSKRAKDMEVVA